MKRLSLALIALLALVLTPQLASADRDCDDGRCDHRYWFVEIAGDGNCYVKFKEQRRTNYAPGRYFSPTLAYIAAAKNPACYRTADWLMQYRYIQRAVN